MPTEKETNAKLDGKVVKLIWPPAEELHGLYANQMLVAHGEGEFHLIFGQLTPPFAMSQEEIPDQVTIKPIAKIVVTPQFLRKIISTLIKNIERFESKEE